MITCCECGKEFEPKKSWQRFCSDTCRDRWHNRERYEEIKRLKKEERIREATGYHVY